MLRRIVGGFVAVVGVLAALLAVHLVTALYPQWPLWLCVTLGVVFLVVMLAAQVGPPPDRSGDDDSEA